MSIAESLLPEFDQEMSHTRRALERVADDKLEWAPHEKSMTLGRLASHLAELPSWGATTFSQDSFDIAPVGGPPFTPVIYASRQEMLAAFDAHVKEARETIAKTADATMFEPWSLLRGGQKIFSMPRVAVLRGFMMNHVIHHRGQLTVYLRLTGAPVPSIYGPSADEPGM